MLKSRGIWILLAGLGLLLIRLDPVHGEGWEQTITLTPSVEVLGENQNGVFNGQGKVEPYSYGTFIEYKAQKWFNDQLRFTVDGGYKFLYKARPDNGGDSFETFDSTAGIHELALNDKLTAARFLEVGLLPCNFGNSLFLNPYNYLSRYVDDASQYGAYTFPGIKYTTTLASSSYALLWLPCLSTHFDSPQKAFWDELLQTGKTKNLMMLQGNYYIGKSRFSLASYLEERDAWQFNNPYRGIGIEVQAPLYSDMIFNWQQLYSNGLAPKGLRTVAGTSEVYEFEAIPGSERDNYHQMIATLGFKPFAFLDVTLGYAYNGRGITQADLQQFSSGVAALGGKSNPNYATVMNSASDIGYSPLKYVRELALINLAIPQITEYLTFNTANFIALDDGSCETNLFLEYTINDQACLAFTGMFRFGDPDSIWGSAFKKSSIGLQLKLVF